MNKLNKLGNLSSVELNKDEYKTRRNFNISHRSSHCGLSHFHTECL